jgi:hypothetical protein
MIDHDRFIEKIFERLGPQYYQSHENLLMIVVEDIVLDEKRFTNNLIQQGSGYCMQCGQCCEWQECTELEDGKCGVYKERPTVCVQYPQWNTGDGRYGLVPDSKCNYAISIAVKETRKEVQKVVDLSRLDGEEKSKKPKTPI